ncbi:hypothetical protein BOX15_Mlig029224g1, partial [Macrostomum lignano]
EKVCSKWLPDGGVIGIMSSDSSDEKSVTPPPLPPAPDAIEILDALNDRGRIHFTVRSSLPTSEGPTLSLARVSVIRCHDDFARLARHLSEVEDFAGCLVPQAPQAPDFAVIRSKLLRLKAGGVGGAHQLTSEEYGRLKLELEGEYRHAFKKAIASHEAFLRSIAEHPRLRHDRRFRNFLIDESEGGSSHSGGTKQRVQSLLQPGLLLTALIDSRSAVVPRILGSVAGPEPDADGDEFFNAQRRFATGYQRALLPALRCLDRLALLQKNTADSLIRVSTAAQDCSRIEQVNADRALAEFLRHFGDHFELYRRAEAQLAAEMDAGLADSLHRLAADCSAVVALPDRRRRLAASLEAASARLRRARQPSEEADAAKARLAAFHRLNEVTDVARLELLGFRKRWLLALCGRLVDTGEMRIRHARSQVQLLKETIDKLRND